MTLKLGNYKCKNYICLNHEPQEKIHWQYLINQSHQQTRST